MDFKPDFERFLTAASHKEPDRVPLCEGTIGYGIQSRFLGREVVPHDLSSQIRFFENAGYDYFPVVVGLLRPGKITEESKITRLLKKMVLEKDPNEKDPNRWNLECSSFIHDRTDFERFPWHAAEIDFFDLERVRILLPEGMKVIAINGKIFSLSWMLMGFENFCLKLLIEPDLVIDVIGKVAEIHFSALDKILSKDYVGAVRVTDDIAFGSGPMISPDLLRKFIFPWYKKMAERCHDTGRLFIMHTDGDVSLVMEDIIEMGVDILHPVDPTCMDIFEVKEKWGKKITLNGNVPNELLRTGTKEEVREYTMSLLKKIAPGGGYFLGAGNSVPDWSRFENYITMRDTALKYGGYPIRI
jgi:uroporphyrinogen decarboxylase